jgi:hypothetical protein
MVRADAHDLGAQGLELRQCRLEGLELLRSRRGERRDEGVDDDRALRRQVRELDGLAVDAVQREVGGLAATTVRSSGNVRIGPPLVRRCGAVSGP